MKPPTISESRRGPPSAHAVQQANIVAVLQRLLVEDEAAQEEVDHAREYGRRRQVRGQAIEVAHGAVAEG